MKNLVLILVFCAAMPFLGLAQSTVLQSDDGTVDSLPKMKVLVVPFHQLRYYFSDCDKDVVLLKVTQVGHDPSIACHTGRHSCFYRRLEDDVWQSIEPVLKDPADIYR